jgi:very-short-patch-repair endonuclease
VVILKCDHCGQQFEKEEKEYNRRIRNGHTRFFCSHQCGSKGKPKKPIREINKKCLYCGSEMILYGKRAVNTYCSAGCATKGSMTEHRMSQARIYGKKNSMYLQRTCDTMLQRESWKYVDLEKFLAYANIKFKFEHPVGKYVCDLFLPERNLVIEFDSDYHNSQKQKEYDKIRDEFLLSRGITVVRVPTEYNSVIPVSAIYSVVNYKEQQ